MIDRPECRDSSHGRNCSFGHRWRDAEGPVHRFIALQERRGLIGRHGADHRGMESAGRRRLLLLLVLWLPLARPDRCELLGLGRRNAGRPHRASPGARPGAVGHQAGRQRSAVPDHRVESGLAVSLRTPETGATDVMMKVSEAGFTRRRRLTDLPLFATLFVR